MKFEICAATDVGCQRKNNEDGFYVSNIACYDTSECILYKKAQAPVLTFVVDGVGGSEAGEIAAKISVSTALSQSIPYTDEDLITLLDNINQRVCRKRETTDTACTIAGMLLTEDTMYWFNIGDSKVYLLSRGFLNQLSIDDTISGLSGEMVENKEPLVQYIGKSGILPHLKEITDISTYLICTDGLTDMVSLDDIERTFVEKQDIKSIALSLIEMAKEKGGHDNITLIIIKPLE